MKIFSTDQIKQADKYTIENEPISSLDLMERAAQRITNKFLEVFPESNKVVVMVGPGNNGGDGLVMARLLMEQGKEVLVYILEAKTYSHDHEVNVKRAHEKGIELTYLRNEDEINNLNFDESYILIDALFGNGLNRPLEGLAAYLVEKINTWQCFTVAVDIPSGMAADATHTSTPENTIEAEATFSIQFPKLSFFFAENERFVGQWTLIDIGLSETFTEKENVNHYFLDPDMIADMIKPRGEFGHKGSFGHACVVAGSKGKMGAAILSAKAALKTGCGLLTMHIPSSGADPVHEHFPEAMIDLDKEPDYISGPILNILNFHCIGFGPGVGQNHYTGGVLKGLIQDYSQSIVIDADGLNLLAKNKTWLQFLNGSTILTPHPGEFDRLTEKHSSGYERFLSQLAFSKKFGVYVVLKGHHTSITTPGGLVFFNSTGNNGMATAGSGDVLTGIITSLCAQKYSPLHACLIGVYLHGYAGDKAAEEVSRTSMVASDIVRHIPDFFKVYER